MATRHRAELKKIRTFPSLVAYLRDELDWPIESDDFDEITFDYTPEELGIEGAVAAKIQEIKRLRPATATQPWGIFFVKFEPKKLPVVALRRILSRVVLKKRASANSSERAAWEVDDLLFVSNFGQGEQRQISFAHFSHEGAKSDLPTLKVLGWDSSDTPLKLDAVADQLTDNLSWPADEADVATWRESWRSAFTLRHGEVVKTSKALAVRLAELARSIRNRINTVLEIETDDGPVTKLMQAFQEALVHDLDEDDFADMYAQTIAYGLLSARIESPGADAADDLAAHMRTSPFLGELMESFLGASDPETIGDAGSALDFDELGVSDVVELLDAANMEAVVRDFGDTNPLEDPVIHFYELFLKEYDAKKRMQRGVFYTPRPVVSYIVRSVHELLQTEFGLAHGLADTATWGEVAKRHQGLTVPDGVDASDRFVAVLDPATGTGTFLVEAIDVIHRTLIEKWQSEGHGEQKVLDLWNDYVPDHLLPRLHGYELLMAPYAIAHLKIGLKLHETGYKFQSDERARVYLTNALEPAHDFSGQFDFAIPALAHEAQAVNAIKAERRFTVVIGNPPYSIQSANLTDTARELVEDYKFVDGERIKERNALQFEKNLQDDYIKFIRLAERCIGASGSGVVGYISNNSYLDSRTFRGMRQHLLRSLPLVSVLDLHGSQKKPEPLDDHGRRDENVFDIQQGVCIAIMRDAAVTNQPAQIERADLVGPRTDKYEFLANASPLSTTWTSLEPSSPFYLFCVFDGRLEAEYSAWPSLRDVATKFSSGIKTHKDRFAYAFTAQEMRDRLAGFVDSKVADEELRAEYALKDTALWELAAAREKVRAKREPVEVVPVLYRPFDVRSIAYSEDIVRYTARQTMQHLDRPNNMALLVSQQQITEGFAHAFVTRIPADCVSVSNRSRETTSAFPLYLSGAGGGRRHGELFEVADVQPNLTAEFLASVAHLLGIGLVEPTQVFDYCYATLHSPTYRSRYASLLKSDFPRLPLTSQGELFRRLTELGGELVALHLVEARTQQGLSAHYDKPAGAWRYESMGPQLPVPLSFEGGEEPVVGQVGWSDDTVWIDAQRRKSDSGEVEVTGTRGFHGVPEQVWNFRIGSYQVCEQWLKERGPKKGQPGRTLTADDIAHYHRIVISLHETIRIMGEIDAVIDSHGGWPGAFQSEGADSTERQPALNV